MKSDAARPYKNRQETKMKRMCVVRYGWDTDYNMAETITTICL